MAIKYVATAAELRDAVAKAVGGDTIALKPGDYGDLRLANMGSKLTSPIHIISLDQDNPAHFNTIKLINTHNLSFDGIKVEIDITPEVVGNTGVVSIIQGSSNISFAHSVIKGGIATTGNLPDATSFIPGNDNVIGFPTATPVQILNASNILFDDVDIACGRRGVVLSKSDGVSIINSEIHDLRGSPIAGNADNILFKGNEVYNISPWHSTNSAITDHAGMFRLWTNAGTNDVIENVRVENNFFYQGEGAGNYMLLEDNSGFGYSNVKFIGNVVHNSQTQGLHIENGHNVLLQNNTFLQSSVVQNAAQPDKNAVGAPSFMIGKGSENVLIENNIVGGIITKNVDALAANIISKNNLIVQSIDPEAPNYAGDLFANPLVSGITTLQDLMLIPQSGIAENIGAFLSHVAGSPKTAVGFITNESMGGVDRLTHQFDASNMFNEHGAIDITNAKIIWTFGDGESTVGTFPTHTFAEAGFYKVQANITLVNGSAHVQEKTIYVETPNAVVANFNNGLNNLGNSDIEVKTTGEVYFSDEGISGNAIRLGNGSSRVTFDNDKAITRNDEFTITIAFKKDEGMENAGGKLLYLSGTSIVSLTSNGISLVGRDVAGKAINLSANNVGINNSDWHQLAYTYSAEKGKAVLYLDGKEVASQAGLTGPQFVTSGHSLHIGGIGSDSFNKGLIDNVAFVRYEMNADDIKDMHLNKMLPSEWMLQSAGNSATLGETIIGSKLADEITGTVNADTINGMAGNDTLNGGDGQDTLSGGAGHDTINGGRGNDKLYGDAGHDKLDGGDGNDTLLGGTGQDVLVGGKGNDTLEGGQGNDNLDGGEGNDKLDGGDGYDKLVGGAGDDTLDGGAHNDNLSGGDGNDTLYGGDGKDILNGGAGINTLDGGDGNDTLNAGSGGFMFGGAGRDSFVFNKGDTGATILDFVKGEDRIDLRLVDDSNQFSRVALFDDAGAMGAVKAGTLALFTHQQADGSLKVYNDHLSFYVNDPDITARDFLI